MIKKITFLTAFASAILLLSACRTGKCDCPKWSKSNTKIEQRG